jgi:hypothetical protein
MGNIETHIWIILYMYSNSFHLPHDGNNDALTMNEGYWQQPLRAESDLKTCLL